MSRLSVWVTWHFLYNCPKNYEVMYNGLQYIFFEGLKNNDCLEYV